MRFPLKHMQAFDYISREVEYYSVREHRYAERWEGVEAKLQAISIFLT